MNEKFNFVFCKYSHGKKDYDFDRCYSCDKTCPSISNLSWEIPVVKQVHNVLYKIHWYIQSRKYEKDYIDEYETTTLKHIFGIKSWDDLSNSNCNLYTMNDFDLTYHKDTDDYSIGVETIYMFKNEGGDKHYIKEILDKFTEWMIDNGYDISKKLELYEVFTEGNNINTHFKTIEECYTYFKLLVNGFYELHE